MEKRIVLGVTGGIAAYKAVVLTSMLVRAGYQVWVIMTEAAAKFVTPLTFQTISRHPVYVDPFTERDPEVISHIDLADKADLFVVAPATANLIGKLANGIADNMLTATLLATTAPVVLAPAMNVHMYAHPAVQKNIETLKRWGYAFIDPTEGPLACGYTGRGRMEEPEAIFAWIEGYFSGRFPWVESPNPDPELERRKAGTVPPAGRLTGKTVLITAGPTREPLDPVRYITNRSSGKMGYALAEAALQRGAKVILVSGKTHLPVPKGADAIPVTTAEEMLQAAAAHAERADWIIGTAAVADYRPKTVFPQKMKKDADTLVLELVKNADILQALGEKKRQGQVLIGFAAETENLLEHARAKIAKKNLDYIVANDVSEADSGFESDYNRVLILSKEGKTFPLPRLPKRELAHRILETILDDLGEQA